MRRDIATLLQQQNVGLARAKAQKLMQEDKMRDLLEVLEIHVGLLLEHFQELDQHPSVVEAASSIIFAAPHIESKDLNDVRQLLIQRFGPDFCQSAMTNQDHHVAASIVRGLSTRLPPAAVLDAFLERVAHQHGVNWSSGHQRHEILNQLSEILDPHSSPVVDLPRLRQLCSRGLPDEPCWLRPRIWKLLFKVLPTSKASWKGELNKQRESYYDLLCRLLDPFSILPPPSTPLLPVDTALLNASNQLSSVPSSLFSGLAHEAEFHELCPLDNSAPQEIKILCARNLDTRLAAIRDRGQSVSSSPATPEIRLEADEHSQQESTLLSSSSSRTVGNAHQKHVTALLRLLYLHTSVNSGNLSPYIASLLVPLYAVLNQEVEPEELAHVEADTFWLFETMVGEFAELEDEEGGNICMKNFSRRLAWADVDLFNDLQGKGLDPALPHYSYRWLAPLLTHTLPLTSVVVIWDVLFSCEMRRRGSNPKIDHLLDICTAMLIHARFVLLRLGEDGRKSPGLWTRENNAVLPLSPLPAWKLGDAFLEGNSLLQGYPIETAGGVDWILQTAYDLRGRREQQNNRTKDDKLSLGARLKVTMWNGFTNQISSPEASPAGSEYDDSDFLSEEGSRTGIPPNLESSPVTSRLATTVWRGLTTQSAMPPSLAGMPAPALPRSSSPPIANPETSTKTSQISLNLWSYAEKLKDSDTVATISKISSNWRAKALIGSWRGTNDPPQVGASSKSSRSESSGEGHTFRSRGGSLPPPDRSDVYSPPARPLYFRPPRDSLIFAGKPTLSPTSISEFPPGDISWRKENIHASFESLTQQNSAPVARSAPRPLLLSPSTPITSSLARHVSRLSSGTPALGGGEWAHVMRANNHHLHTGSQSSVSSLSPSDAFVRPHKSGRSDWDSDTNISSRRVPLNRKSVSPMAPGFRAYQGGPTSPSLTTSMSGSGPFSPPLSIGSAEESNLKDTQEARIDIPISPPPTMHHRGTAVEIESQGNIVGSDGQKHVNLSDIRSVDLSRKKITRQTPSPSQYQQEDPSDSSAVEAQARGPRLRSKRYPARLPNLDIEDHVPRSRVTAERKLTIPNSLTVEWPAEDQDIVPTPRASSFDVDEPSSPVSSRSHRTRKISADAQERKLSAERQDVRIRKISTGQRTRKTSGDSKDVVKRTRDSSAEEGDDEGYDELLSAYESEEGLETPSRW